MKQVTIMAQVDPEKCKGCKTCEKVCPVYAIHVENRIATSDPMKCMGCANVLTGVLSTQLQWWNAVKLKR